MLNVASPPWSVSADTAATEGNDHRGFSTYKSNYRLAGNGATPHSSAVISIAALRRPIPFRMSG